MFIRKTKTKLNNESIYYRITLCFEFEIDAQKNMCKNK